MLIKRFFWVVVINYAVQSGEKQFAVTAFYSRQEKAEDFAALKNKFD